MHAHRALLPLSRWIRLLLVALGVSTLGMSTSGLAAPRLGEVSGTTTPGRPAPRALDPVQRPVPRWLIELPTLELPVTLGVAGIQPGDKNATEEAARTQAAEHFQLQQGVTVRLDRTRRYVPGDLTQLDASQLEPLASGKADPTSVQCLETWEDTERGLLWCLAVSSRVSARALRPALRPSMQRVPYPREEPAWMRSPTAQGGDRAATGYALRTPRSYAEQLERALRRGIISLAFQGEVDVSATLEAVRSGAEQRVESTTQFSGEVTVRDIGLQALWRAAEGDALYLLVTGKVR